MATVVGKRQIDPPERQSQRLKSVKMRVDPLDDGKRTRSHAQGGGGAASASTAVGGSSGGATASTSSNSPSPSLPAHIEYEVEAVLRSRKTELGLRIHVDLHSHTPPCARRE